MIRIISVVSGKGGVGKTTVVTNLSTVLSSSFNKRVTVIDCNVTSSNLALHFGAYPNATTLNNVLKGEAELKDAIFLHPSGVKIVSASLNLADLVGVDVAILNEKIKNALPEEDFIFLDSAPGFGKEAISAIKACEESIVVSTPDVPSLMDVIREKKVLEELKVKLIGLILNKVTHKKFELTEEEIRKSVDLPIIAMIPFSEKFMESLAVKVPLVSYDKYSDASFEFHKLASFLTGEPFEFPRVSFLQKLRRIFGRLS